MKRTIPLHFRRAAEAVPDRLWLLADDVQLTYGAALARVERAAAWFRAAGIGRESRVVVTARNTPAYLLTWLALMEVGATEMPVNPSSSEAELRGFAEQARPSMVVSDPSVGDALAERVRVVDVEEVFAGPPDGRGPAAVDERDVAVMIPTSGTTGRSKLVMQTHLAYVMAGEGFPYWLGLDGEDRLMTSLPLFHINAPAYSVLGSVAARASLVLLPRFSPSSLLDSARHYGATEVNSIGAMLEIMMRQPPRRDDADNPIRIWYTGPSPTRERQLEFEARFGVEVTCGYALSETPYGLVWRRGTRPYGALGWPRQHPTLGHVNDARVMVEEKVVGEGETGELELRNPAIMRGYYEMPEETGAVLVDGWLRTGDLVTRNADGTYTFVDRKKQVIRRRGENLSPAEVEAVLERHPDVGEAAVIAVPSELTEDDVKAFVVAAPGRSVDPWALREFAAGLLARFKVPRYLEVVAELPHTPTGRLAKHRLPQQRTNGEVDLEVSGAP